MNNIYKIILAIFIPISLSGQLQESFSDGDFTTAPVWSGSVTDFVVNTESELQLQATEVMGNQTSYLSTAAATANETTWEFSIRLDFSPSGENFARVYLNADRADLSDEVRGYYVKIGSGGSDDALELYRQDGANSELLISGTVGAVASSPAVRVRVMRSADLTWSLAADYEQNGEFVEEGNALDATYNIGQYFGWQCNYTSSRSDKFFLDDILIDPLFVDNEAPKILSAESTSANTIVLLFNESVNESATDLNNYSITPTINISNVQLDPANLAQVILTTTDAFNSGTTYTLQVKNVSDLNDNAIIEEETTFTFIKVETAAAYDILINEIMADPTPALGLPEVEFLELYNRSNTNFNLENFELVVGSNVRFLPDFTLAADEYVIICAAANEADFAGFGKVIGLESFPALRNSGEQITLYNTAGDFIHAVNYRTSWYQSSGKADGGWTLELINPSATCLEGIENWRASENGNGGTPGRANSILNAENDNAQPELLRAFPVNETRLRLFFNKKMDLERAEDVMNYQVENISIASAELELPAAQTVVLTLNEPLVAGQTYMVSLTRQVTDCVGNTIGDMVQISTALPATIEPQDIIINEVLYQPETGGKDFVELYNRSDKALNIADLIIANRDENGSIDVANPIEGSHLLFPDQYVVLTEEVEDITTQYPENPCGNVSFGSNFVPVDLPTYSADSGTVVIYLPDTLQEKIIDEFTYRDELHSPLLDDIRGVSLERISAETPTNVAANWYSAAATVGFATPGCPNSIQSINSNVTPNESIFQLENITFSPDGDGFEDFLFINYTTDRPDFVATLRIYNMNGQLLQTLATNESLATDGFYKWDGSTDSGQKAKLGIYIVYGEVFAPDGTQQSFKETCVVAGKLE